jgi:ADP-ribose pyrophosphatase YjhB (NUDIX family)
MNMDTLTLLDEIQTIARNGLHYAAGHYDRERYTRLLDLASHTYAQLLDLPDVVIQARFRQELGYITPKVGADAAIFNPQGEILLMDRVEGSGWCLPCGWVEPNEKPAQTAVRETREETGLEVTVRQLVGVFTRMPSAQNGPHSMIAVVHLCDVIGGELTLSPEGLDLRYWPIDAVPRWHATHEQYARAAYQMWQTSTLLPAISN